MVTMFSLSVSVYTAHFSSLDILLQVLIGDVDMVVLTTEMVTCLHDPTTKFWRRLEVSSRWI